LRNLSNILLRKKTGFEPIPGTLTSEDVGNGQGFGNSFLKDAKKVFFEKHRRMGFCRGRGHFCNFLNVKCTLEKILAQYVST